LLTTAALFDCAEGPFRHREGVFHWRDRGGPLLTWWQVPARIKLANQQSTI